MRIIWHGGVVGRALRRYDIGWTLCTRTFSSVLRRRRALGFVVIWSVLIGAGLLSLEGHASSPGQFTIPMVAPILQNPDLECSRGYGEASNDFGEPIFIPAGWSLARVSGGPTVHSARIFFEQRADDSADCATERVHVERIAGRDSLVIRARDLETPPDPGKPFDFVLYQQTDATVGGVYSLSGWLLSLCGGSAVPSDCPDETYIVKAIGIDPQGGTDPAAPGIIWAESLDNFVDAQNERIGWTNLRMAATAQHTVITVFVRLYSPFQWHGNHGFVDALGLVRAPVVAFLPLPTVIRGSREITLQWIAHPSPDVVDIPGGTYELYVDVQTRPVGESTWRDIAVDASATDTVAFTAPCVNTSYEFRVRARSEQPPAPPEGVTPNQRYPGIWSEPSLVFFEGSQPSRAEQPELPELHTVGSELLYLPLVGDRRQC